MTQVLQIHARYKAVDGWHVFHSDEMPGLYVASRDAAQAFRDVGPAIALLVKLDTGADVRAVSELSFEEFQRQVAAQAGAGEAVAEQRFSLLS